MRPAARLHIGDVLRVRDVRRVEDAETADPVFTHGVLHALRATIDAAMLGRDLVFEVNHTLLPPDRDININGDVFYLNSVTGQDDPAVKINPANSIQKAPSITFAGVDLPRYRDLAISLVDTDEAIYSNSDLTVNLNASNWIETPLPRIIFAEGDIHVSGNYDWSLLVVAKGNIYIDDNLTFNDDPPSPTHPQIGLLADGDVIIPDSAPDNLSVQAFVIADGDSPGSKGTFSADGAKFSKSSLNFEGAIATRGRIGRSAVDLNVFRERNYLFDNSLSTNPSIPFSPFIANIIHWQEVSPFDAFPPAP